ncbi:hypothetical protein CIK94_07950 [Prevotella sp. P4-51]|uniref:oligosaccharide flippase family protein n=1 Tax=Prevotella sp. P4-51 TaxID=2024228 RepID=UPI000B9640E4|nr:oligosaccharide flippase family protein [Prevotella sp. P4-51]OYP73942.1 hypothetical protein CIK94_07950 [Prevotella sp. P4-51]
MKMDSNKKMVVNTVILYAKLLIEISVNLYSTRLILLALGVEDFGIVNLISGIVALLSFVQNSMSVSSQRYMSVAMGQRECGQLERVFCSSFMLHFILAILIFFLLECLVPVIFDSSIQIPEQRLDAAKNLYQLTILGTLLIIITVPYDAVLNAHENMLMYSIATIVESTIRLIGALVLLVYNNDKLIFYGVLLITIRLVSMLIKYIYCHRHYIETRHFVKAFDKKLMKEMFFFAFWNMFGALALTGRAQGVAIVMNTFMGVVVNAAYGIANQVSGQLLNFTATITKAMNPQIMQRAGVGDNIGMISLSLKQCKYSSILLSYAIVPLLFSMEFILKIWLKDVPDYALNFCMLILVVSVIQQLSIGLMSMIQATGIIRNYQVCVSLCMLLNIPIAYMILKLNARAEYVIVGMIVVEVFACALRIFFAKRLANLSIRSFVISVIAPVLLIYFFSCIGVYGFERLLLDGVQNVMSFIVLTSLSIVFISISALIVLSKDERLYLFNIIRRLIKKII